MAGILGGSNAFNFLNFVAGVVTIVVNVNNNINNNNNNLNNVNVNAQTANNANANVNNNGANVVVAMPGRRRKRSSARRIILNLLQEKPVLNLGEFTDRIYSEMQVFVEKNKS
ncbi:putative uncharacterized protein DDB_G0283223 [Eurytemora carolleeae]|uniref:putative uncharacterized protein DDB_G0283223 n=1 Tax=Eurytemora carolleeae TaxID=1294199 RepID=UPI000C7657D7|nr:putative uncharacterized protein DDB_G0283223 [Eurytemora carolleeae]|eukprot:XP_023327305.1 putative uncharacterized protein DDB_G0283223 [Eurytemora affinis]